MSFNSISFFSFVALFLGVTAFAQEEKPWETAAVIGLATMNKGDGEAFNAVAHKEFKEKLHNFMVLAAKSEPDSKATTDLLKECGVKTLLELERMSLNDFVKKVIKQMHLSLPETMQKSFREARFETIKSEIYDDAYRVEVNAHLKLNGQTVSRPIIVLIKQEDGAWKYAGDLK